MGINRSRRNTDTVEQKAIDKYYAKRVGSVIVTQEGGGTGGSSS